MPFFYYKAFKVPMWVLVGETEYQSNIIKYFEEKGALHQEWPLGFKDTLMSLKSKGWAHEIKDNGMFIINPQLLAIACDKHVKEKLHRNARIEAVIPMNRVDRNVKEDFDYERIFATVLSSQEGINLSQCFMVGEKCHGEDPSKIIKCFVTKMPSDDRLNPASLLDRIADKVITIGNGPNYTINMEGSKGYKKVIDKVMASLDNKRNS